MYRPRRGARGPRFQQRQPPINVGDELEVTIESVGAKGDGLAKKEGFVIFVPGAQKGQTLRVRITKVLRNMGFAEVVGEVKAEEGEAVAKEEKQEEGEALEEEKEEETEEGIEEGEAEESETFGEE